MAMILMLVSCASIFVFLGGCRSLFRETEAQNRVEAKATQRWTAEKIMNCCLLRETK